MSKLKTVKEVCEITGLNRKLLYDYKEVVNPTDYANIGFDGNDGYKLYDDDAIVKLQQIAIFRELGMSRADIKKRINDVCYDSNKLLEEQIVMLKSKKDKIERLILVAEQLKMIGMKNNVLSNFHNVDLNTMAQNIEKWQNSTYFQYFSDLLKENSVDYDKEIEPIVEKLTLLEENEYNTSKAMAIIRRLFEITTKYYGMAGFITIFIMVLSAEGEGEIASEMEMSKNDAKAIRYYLEQDVDVFWDEVISVVIDYWDIIGKDFSDIRVKKMVAELKQICSKHFGMRRNEDFGMIFEFMKIEPYRDGESYITYILNALKYYTND